MHVVSLARGLMRRAALHARLKQSVQAGQGQAEGQRPPPLAPRLPLQAWLAPYLPGQLCRDPDPEPASVHACMHAWAARGAAALHLCAALCVAALARALQADRPVPFFARLADDLNTTSRGTSPYTNYYYNSDQQ